MGPVALRVRNLDSILSFYESDLGLSVNRDGAKCELAPKQGSSSYQPLLRLIGDPEALTPAEYSAGLYHYAVVVPDRESLASTFLALGNRGVYFEGFSDHLVSESLYLRDPEGNGIEIYRDRPKEEESSDGGIAMDTRPLDLDSMILDLSRNAPDLKANPVPFPRGARIGHVHLKVTDIETSKKFYHEKLGMDITVDGLPGACFLSYGGYHHHVGINTWESRGGPPHKEDEAGLESFTLQDPDRDVIDEISSNGDEATVLDPDAIKIILRSGTQG